MPRLTDFKENKLGLRVTDYTYHILIQTSSMTWGLKTGKWVDCVLSKHRDCLHAKNHIKAWEAAGTCSLSTRGDVGKGRWMPETGW